MYNSIDSFFLDFEHEFNSTNKYFDKIEDKHLDTIFNENIRSIGWLSWHIISTIPEMLNHAGLRVESNVDLNVQPNTMKEMIAIYNSYYQSAIEEIRVNWNDIALNDDVKMYGQTWKKGIVLSSLLFHQCHHRGQLSILMRLANIVVPGIIGPSKEEWVSFGMQPHK
jgi:uncharacterized damage-inducible protein DinB